ncbi:hypothetical protein OAB94_00605 [Flavobacteriaceae bacterium]|jgi:hypothetical protein|nr:hypothetical protein [Flavobacteriaceae bacterium]
MKKLKDISVAELQQKYLDLIRPINFIKTFKDDAEFTEWARQGTTEDLDWAIKNFEKDELYKYCNILKQVRDENRSI